MIMICDHVKAPAVPSIKSIETLIEQLKRATARSPVS